MPLSAEWDVDGGDDAGAPPDGALFMLPSVLEPLPPKVSGDAHTSAAVTRTVSFAPGRSALVVLPAEPAKPARLLAMIHGLCTPVSVICGEWKDAASHAGLLVCPSGNATCGDPGLGPPTWDESFADMDADVERAVAAARKTVGPVVSRDGAVLAGFSRGGYAAVILAVRHPGRWPFLILNEADVDLTLAMVHNAGIRAVAFIGGEWGSQLAGERKTADALAAEGFPAKVWVMPRVGHTYSSDIDSIMGEALDFVLSHDAPAAPPRDAAAGVLPGTSRPGPRR